MSDTPRHDRLLELLAEQATGVLSDAERAELDRLSAEHGPGAERELNAVIGGLLTAFDSRGAGTMPAELKARLIADGERLARGAAVPPPTYRLWSARLGWLAAAVFAIVAVAGWWPRLAGPPTYKQQLLTLTSQDPQAQIIDFQATQDPSATGVTGKVYWSGKEQQGFLALKGLPANDPTKEQYQLWLFDEKRGDIPVDGGVFNLADGQLNKDTGEFLIPIHAKLSVHKPVLFAVTVEKPDGVVVTTKERLVLIAQPPKAEPPTAPPAGGGPS